MSAVLTPSFGDAIAQHRAAAANATFERAIKCGYSRVAAQAFAREAKREATDWETAEDTAFRLVRPMHVSATAPAPNPRGAA